MRRETAVAAASGALLFLVAALAPAVGLFTDQRPADVQLFQRYGEQTLAGEIPYRDFFIEYPPAALVAFVLPALGPTEHFTTVFKAVQIGFGCAVVALLLVALGAAGRRGRGLYAAAAFAALSPLALGPTVLNRFDLWPTALTLAALAALASDRLRLGLALLAVAVAAKGFALVVLPVAFVYVLRRRGRSAAWRGVAVFAAVLLAVYAPFLALGPGGIRFSTFEQLGRGLHVESLPASLLAAADRVGLYDATVVAGYAHELAGALPDAAAAAATLLQLAALVAVWVAFARGAATPGRLLLAGTASVATFVALGKVLSPQFLIWLLPLAPLAGGVAAPALTLAAAALTRFWFPGRFADVVAVGDVVWVVLARNLLLVGLAVLLLVSLRRRSAVE